MDLASGDKHMGRYRSLCMLDFGHMGQGYNKHSIVRHLAETWTPRIFIFTFFFLF